MQYRIFSFIVRRTVACICKQDAYFKKCCLTRMLRFNEIQLELPYNDPTRSPKIGFHSGV